MMTLQLDGPVSLLMGDEQLAARGEKYVQVSMGAQMQLPRFCGALAKFLLQKGCQWRHESFDGATHVYVCENNGQSRVLRIQDVDDHEDIPIFRPFNARTFASEIDRLIKAGDEYMRVMGETFFIGMEHSAKSRCHH